MRIVQVCNVGNICGGTAACAWSITRALPQCRHTVLFLSPPTAETVQAFSPVEICAVSRIDEAVLAPFQPDILILHNTAASHVGTITSCIRLQYLHSLGNQGDADLTVACSQWLAAQQKKETPVLYQPVPIPPYALSHRHRAASRQFDDALTIGRICTPQLRKWPHSCLEFYRFLTPQFPAVRWEFIGCPLELQKPLSKACGERVRFLSSGWSAREHLWRWHALLYQHPTLTESFGRTVAEAMRGGCIPIVDARGGFLEQVDHGETGFLCGSDDDFAHAVHAISAAGRRWAITRAARQAATMRFSLMAFANRFRELLHAASLLPSNLCSS